MSSPDKWVFRIIRNNSSPPLTVSARAYFLFCLSVLLVLGGCEPGTGSRDSGFSNRRESMLAGLSACPRDGLSQAPALVEQGRCGELEVKERPDQDQGRSISLRYMVLPAQRAEPEEDALVILVGGPGQAATRDGLLIAQLLGEVRLGRDILLLDQRGTGALSPFQCDFGEDDSQLQGDLESLLQRQRSLLAACLEQLDEVDPAYYTTDMAVADLEALRQHLGYRQLTLWGGSYGTRVALSYLRAWPESTRALILDGVAPVAIRLPLNLARDASAAFDQVLDLCAADSDCDSAYPELRTRYQRLMDDLRQQRQVELRDAVDASRIEVPMDANLLAPLLRAVLYGREVTRLLPYIIDQATAGNFQPLAAVLPREAGINQGMFLSVVCNEDLASLSEEEWRQALADELSLQSPLLMMPVRDACESWPRRQLPESHFAPVVSAVPVLILSGELDPVTPPRWGELAGETLSSHRHLVVRGAAHITSPYGCMPTLIADFIRDVDPQSLDASCLDTLRQRPFFLNNGGSANP